MVGASLRVMAYAKSEPVHNILPLIFLYFVGFEVPQYWLF
jgi:hypothetical protein